MQYRYEIGQHAVTVCFLDVTLVNDFKTQKVTRRHTPEIDRRRRPFTLL